MPIVEYPSGSGVPRRDRADRRRVEPGLAGAGAGREGAPNVLFIVLDDTGFGQLGCYGSPIETPNLDAHRRERAALQQHAHDGAVLAEPVVHRHGPQPSQQRDGVHHRVRDRLSGLQRHHPVRERDAVRDAARARLQHVHGRQVAPDAEQPGDRGRARTTAGRSAAGFERFYGFLGGDTSQWYPDLVYDNHQVEPPKTPEEGYHLTEDLVDKAISFIADAKQVDPDKPFYLHLCFGATHAPHHVPKEWADKYEGKFDDGWDAYREKTFARQKELGIVPADAELSRHDPDVPDWDALPRAGAAALRRMMEVFAGFLEPHRPPDRAAARLPDDARRARQHADHGHLRQRRQRRGRPDRHDQRGAVLQQRAGAARGEPRADRRDRRPEALQPLPVGLDVGGQHAVPAVEARDLPRRRQRPVHRLLAEGDQGAGRGPHPVRAHHRHGADRARPARHRAAGRDPGRHAVADARRQLRAHPRRRRGGRRAITPSTSRCSATARSTTTAGGRSARGRARRSPRRARPSATPISADTLSELDATGWELYHVDEDFAETTNVAAEQPRPADRDDRHLVRRGRQVRRAADRRQRPRPHDRREAADRAAARHATRTCPNTQSVPYFAAPKVLNRPHSITADVEIPEQGAEGVLLCQGTAAGGYSLLHQGRQAALRPQLRRPRSCSSVESDDVVPAGKHELRFEFEPTGAAGHAPGQGRARAAAALHRRHPRRRTPTPPSRRRSCSTPAP